MQYFDFDNILNAVGLSVIALDVYWRRPKLRTQSPGRHRSRKRSRAAQFRARRLAKKARKRKDLYSSPAQASSMFGYTCIEVMSAPSKA